jgi:hypothetical protein
MVGTFILVIYLNLSNFNKIKNNLFLLKFDKYRSKITYIFASGIKNVKKRTTKVKVKRF